MAMTMADFFNADRKVISKEFNWTGKGRQLIPDKHRVDEIIRKLKQTARLRRNMPRRALSLSLKRA